MNYCSLCPLSVHSECFKHRIYKLVISQNIDCFIRYVETLPICYDRVRTSEKSRSLINQMNYDEYVYMLEYGIPSLENLCCYVYPSYIFKSPEIQLIGDKYLASIATILWRHVVRNAFYRCIGAYAMIAYCKYIKYVQFTPPSSRLANKLLYRGDITISQIKGPHLTYLRYIRERDRRIIRSLNMMPDSIITIILYMSD